MQHAKTATSSNRTMQAWDFLDLTEDDPQRAEDAEHAEQASNLLWLSTALEWGSLCITTTVMYWAEAIQKVPAFQGLVSGMLSMLSKF